MKSFSIFVLNIETTQKEILAKMIRPVLCVFLICYFTSSFGQQISYSDCTDSDPKAWCKINKIEIAPCKEAGTNKACNLKKGKTYSMKMEFTALQSIESMKASPFWAAATGDLPFVGMKDNACEFTQCPVAQNVDQTYDFQLKIAKSLPRGQFDVKWKFWVNDDTEKGCCARFNLKLS